MAGLPASSDPRLLVGSANSDDAGIYKLDEERALVQTLDFFTPIVDDPYLYGQIAAANSLSDVYAMGGRPITAMAIAGMPSDILSNDEIAEIFRGGAELSQQAGCSLVGGHTIKNPEPIYGLSVTGLVHPQKYLSNNKAKEGDILVLTKPLGTGIIATAAKKKQCSEESIHAATQSMITLNLAGAFIGERNLANSCTDITGFGLLGHLSEICEASHLGAQLNSSAIPPITEEVHTLIDQDFIPGGSRKNFHNIEHAINIDEGVTPSIPWLLADAQTSGGLLITCSEDNLSELLELIQAHSPYHPSIIGTLTGTSNITITKH